MAATGVEAMHGLYEAQARNLQEILVGLPGVCEMPEHVMKKVGMGFEELLNALRAPRGLVGHYEIYCGWDTGLLFRLVRTGPIPLALVPVEAAWRDRRCRRDFF